MSYHRVAMATAERVLALYRDKYPDVNVRHFYEKLKDSEGVSLSYSWMNQTLQGCGLRRNMKLNSFFDHRMSSPNSLISLGWKRREAKKGDQVIVEGFRAKDSSNVANARAGTLPDARVMRCHAY